MSELALAQAQEAALRLVADSAALQNRAALLAAAPMDSDWAAFPVACPAEVALFLEEMQSAYRAEASLDRERHHRQCHHRPSIYLVSALALHPQHQHRQPQATAR